MKFVKIDGLNFIVYALRRVQQSTNVDMVPTLEDDLGLVRKHSFVDLWSIVSRLSLESDSGIPSDFLTTNNLDDVDAGVL